MSAPITKSQLAFELPPLSYIDTRWEEPDAQPAVAPVRQRGHGFASWVAANVAAYRTWRQNARALGELSGMTDRELSDVGLTRGDLRRVFDDRFNRDLLQRSQVH
jgi:uncharacterized protein YjiS (DUF1127 family)